MVLVLDLEPLDVCCELAELDQFHVPHGVGGSPAVAIGTMDSILWGFWMEERSLRMQATIISQRIGPGRPAVLDELWDCRARRETYKRWFLVAEANWVIWSSWSRSLSRVYGAAGQWASSFPRSELRARFRGQVEKWESEMYWRYRKYRTARREGERFFVACHPEMPVPVCPRAG